LLKIGCDLYLKI